MEAVAKGAGVSRATAFRQMGIISELLVQRSATPSDTSRQPAPQWRGPPIPWPNWRQRSSSARELPNDRPVYGLIEQHSTSSHHPGVHLTGVRVLTPVLLDGRSGEIRSDVSTDELVDFLLEQTYLAAEADDRSEDAVRRRFRHFIAPALMPPGTAEHARPNSESELRTALRRTLTAVEDLAE